MFFCSYVMSKYPLFTAPLTAVPAQPPSPPHFCLAIITQLHSVYTTSLIFFDLSPVTPLIKDSCTCACVYRDHSAFNKVQLRELYPYCLHIHVEPPVDLSGPTMTCIRGQEGSLIGQLYRKRFFGYSDYTFAFAPSNCHLYQFRNELVSLTC